MTTSGIIRFLQWTIIVLLAVALVLYVVFRPVWARPVVMGLGAAYIIVRLFGLWSGRRRQ
ncbi:MAG: hypothetical protein J1D86_04175 [Alistipes sp.]|nr:hypothetical protein [Alistipes sp.]